MANRYWALQDPGQAPTAVIALIDGDGLPRRFVPGEGLVDWPAAVMFTHNGETGATQISEPEARRLMRSGLGKVTPRILATQRGKARTLPVPG